MSTSVFQNFRAALATAVTARLTTQSITGVTVTEYPPLGTIDQVDRVYFGRIRVIQEPLTMGGTGRQVAESVEVDCFIEAIKPGGDLDDLALMEQRAEVILSAVENAVRADSDVGSSVMFADIQSFESIPIAESDRVGFMVEAVITGEANI